MDTLEINKFVAGIVGALLIYLGANFIAEFIYHEHGYAKAAYVIEVEEEEVAEVEEEVIDIAALIETADLAGGEKVFKKCASCHVADAAENGVGPHLLGVVGRPIAAIDGYNYSGAFQEFGGEWDAETLSAFLENPKAYIKGTKMSYNGLKKPQDRADLIAWLDSLDD